MPYIYENKDKDTRVIYPTMRAIEKNEGINWHTLRYQFKKKNRDRYEKHNFRIDKV